MDPESQILGTGWSFPPKFSRSSAGVEMVSGVEDIRESLRVLLSTMCGERIMLPGFGCSIWEYVFQSISKSLLTKIEDEIASAILSWEPRIDVARVSAVPNPIPGGSLVITVEFTVSQTNHRDSVSYEFNIEDGSTPLRNLD